MHLPDVKNQKLLYREKFISKNFPEFYDYINTLFPGVSYNESLYRYIHNITDPPLCPVCGKKIPYRNSPAGYGKFCCSKCMGESEERNELIVKTKLMKYGDPHYNNPDKATQTMNKKYGGRGTASPIIKQRIKNTCNEKFGINNVFESQEWQEIARQKKYERYGDPYYSNSEKRKQTCIEKYGVSNPMQNEKIINKFNNTMQERYGVNWAMNNPILARRLSVSLEKSHRLGKYNETRKKNQSFNISKIEHDFKEYLDSQKIRYEYQYKSDVYPFDCDFYLIDYDLYIEIQGHWTHGKKPYIGSDEDMNIVNFWRSKNTKYYNHAIYIWTDRDVKKREIAEINKLNYLEIFSINLDSCINALNNEIKIISHADK